MLRKVTMKTRPRPRGAPQKLRGAVARTLHQHKISAKARLKTVSYKKKREAKVKINV